MNEFSSPQAGGVPPHLVAAVDQWFAKNTGLGGCSDKDVADLAAMFWDVHFDGGRESVEDALAVVESFGPGIQGLNDTFARQILLAAEVRRLQGIYAAAVKSRSEMRQALIDTRALLPAAPGAAAAAPEAGDDLPRTLMDAARRDALTWADRQAIGQAIARIQTAKAAEANASMLRAALLAWKKEAEHQYGLLREQLYPGETNYPVEGALDAYAEGSHPAIKALAAQQGAKA